MNKFLRHKKVRYHLSFFLVGFLSFHFLLLHSGLSGYVLCIGNDGHIAFERSVDNTSCFDTHVSTHLETCTEHVDNCFTSETDHCGDCQDISLASDCDDEQARTSQKFNESQTTNLGYLLIASSDQPISYPSTVNCYKNRPLKNSSTLASIKATVLLI